MLASEPVRASDFTRTCDLLGSTGCQPVLFGSLPKSSWHYQEFSRQAAANNRRQPVLPRRQKRARNTGRTAL